MLRPPFNFRNPNAMEVRHLVYKRYDKLLSPLDNPDDPEEVIIWINEMVEGAMHTAYNIGYRLGKTDNLST